jgi:hypothetical protein
VLAVQPGGLRGQVLRGQHRTVPPAAEFPADVQLDRPLAERVEHAEPPEHAGRVRRDHDARADLAQFPRLLEDDRRHAGLVQERRGGQPAEPAADDRDPRHQPPPGTGARRAATVPLAKRRAERRWPALSSAGDLSGIARIMPFPPESLGPAKAPHRGRHARRDVLRGSREKVGVVKTARAAGASVGYEEGVARA